MSRRFIITIIVLMSFVALGAAPLVILHRSETRLATYRQTEEVIDKLRSYSHITSEDAQNILEKEGRFSCNYSQDEFLVCIKQYSIFSSIGEYRRLCIVVWERSKDVFVRRFTVFSDLASY